MHVFVSFAQKLILANNKHASCDDFKHHDPCYIILNQTSLSFGTIYHVIVGSQIVSSQYHDFTQQCCNKKE